MGRRRRPGLPSVARGVLGAEFDWRAAEARLNAYPQFFDRGQHFVHVRRNPSRPPVLLAHGWPSSFVEMLPLTDLLDVDVVVPSLPGFLYSELPDGPLTRAAIAESFHTLMTETLGYERYFAFGGDIGGAASGWLATMYPQEVAGLHVIHGPFPADFDASPITPEEQAFLDADEERDESDAGYSWIMSTRPTRSRPPWPTPRRACGVDRRQAARLERLRRRPRSRFDRDTLCTILTLYWAPSLSARRSASTSTTPQCVRPQITVPVAVTQSQRAAVRALPALHRRARRERHPPVFRARRGGHFLAFEEPQLVADELSAFMRAVG